MKRRIVALLLVLVLVLGALAGCGNKTEEPTPGNTPSQPSNSGEKEPEKEPEPTGNFKPTSGDKDTNTLRVPVSTNYSTFDPNKCGESTELNVVPNLYEGLGQKDANDEWAPCLAKSWTLSDDGTYADFELRDDVYFHNGEHFTAEDVVYSWRRTELSQQTLYLFDYTTWEVVDEYTVRCNMVYPDDAPFEDLIDYILGFAIMCKSWCEGISEDTQYDMKLTENGTGPYYLESVDHTTRDITLKKFDKYWGEAYIDTVVLKVITGDAEMAFESGDIDYTRYKYNDLPNVLGFDNVYQYDEISGLQWYICVNCARPPMDNRNVRKAMILALDREEIGMVACDNGGIVSWNIVSSNLKKYYRDVCEHLDNDPDEARRIMAAEGYSESNPCKVVLLGNTAAYEVMKERLDRCYFDCTIEAASDSSRLWGGDFDITIIQLILGDLAGYALLFNDGFNIAQDFNYELAAQLQSAKTEEEIVAAQIAMFDEYAYVPIALITTFYVVDSDLEIVDNGIKPTSGLDFYYKNLRWK